MSFCREGGKQTRRWKTERYRLGDTPVRCRFLQDRKQEGRDSDGVGITAFLIGGSRGYPALPPCPGADREELPKAS